MLRTIRFALPGLVALALSACSSTNPMAPSALTSGDAGTGAPTAGTVAAAGGAVRGKPQSIEGRIEGFPAAPAASVIVAGVLVETHAGTTFTRGGRAASFADLALGQRVKATGTFTGSGLLASDVRIQNTNGDLPGRGNQLPPPPDSETEPVPVPDPEPVPAPLPPPLPDPLPAFDLQVSLGLISCQGFTCGFAFSPTQDILVVALGQWDQGQDGLGVAAPVTLWQGDGSPLATVSVPAGTGAPLTGEHRYVDITPVRLVAGQVYVIGSAFTGSQAPTFDPARLDPAFTAIEGRLVFADAYPLRTHTSFFGGGNFQFVPAP